MSAAILTAHKLVKHYSMQRHGFGSRKGVVRAVDGVSIAINAGEVFGLVGESGCGKSSLGRILLRLEELTSGSVSFEGRDLSSLNRKQLKGFRRDAQIIYQDPYSALNPRHKVGDIIAEPLVIHKQGSAAQRQKRVEELLEVVGLRPSQARRYPHEFSGGQRQRIVIARALALQPKFILADEPVSALDVSIQAQVINLLLSLRKSFGLTYLFISHDLSVVEHICNRVAVMYLGRIVELADKQEFYAQALHPYSQALLSAAPKPEPGANRQRIVLHGDVPSPINPPDGCAFNPRCPEARERCKVSCPEFRELSPERWVACHFR